MAWTEQDSNTRSPIHITPEKEAVLDKAREESLPRLEKQASRGQVPLEPVKLQPVRSPGIYEGEFGSKDGDVIFHFWPYGFHEAQRRGVATPKFRGDFQDILRRTMEAEFGSNRIEVSQDLDMGAFFVKAAGWGKNQFHYDVSVAACQKLHKSLGGEG